MCYESNVNKSIKYIAKKVDNINWYFDLENFKDTEMEAEIKICNRALELCIERCIEEKFNIEDWILVDASSARDKLLKLSFYNKKEKKNLVFGVYRDDVIPYILIDGVQYPRNLIKKAIYEDTNVDYLYTTIRKRGVMYKEKSKDLKVEVDLTVKELSSRIFSSKYYDKLSCNYSEKKLIHIEKLELCLERCIEEQFPIENWNLSDLEYINEDITIVSFLNRKSKKEIMFTVYEDGYATPVFYDNGILSYSNTVKEAIV
ncbi:hypothetical protein C4097_06240 [Clostridioides difficile]|nr:hypothetical protein [Clostridioides difficile]